MNINKIISTFCWLLISLFHFGCQSTSTFERRPGLFQNPLKEEQSGSIHIRTYTKRVGAQYPFSILEIDGKEIPLKNAHIRYPNICYECVKSGIEAVGFQVYSSNENLRGTWVLIIRNKEQKYFHLNSSNGVEIVWENTNYSHLPTFDAVLGNCIPNDCNSNPSLME